MSDINRVREWTDTDGHERNQDGDYDWPFPTEVVESEVTGDLREKVLARVGKSDAGVRIIERVVSGGYSEYTQENDYEFELTVDGAKVWEASEYWGENNLTKFLAWVDGEEKS